jgi:hypothetical protein
MDFLDERVLRFFSLLHKYNVRYLLVGGFATNFHGFNRLTLDLDIWIKESKENRVSLRKAIEELHNASYPEIERIQFISGWSAFRLYSDFDLDIMTDLSGLPQDKFDSCFEIASEAHIDEVVIPFLHINHLIESKQKAGRPKDLLDVTELEKIRAAQSGDLTK